MRSTRRRFLAASAGALAAHVVRPGTTWPVRPRRPVIERLTLLAVPGAFHRSIAMNAYDRAPKGKAGTTRIVRVVLSDGTVGAGVEGYRRFGNDSTLAFARSLIGREPRSLYRWDGDRIAAFADDVAEALGAPEYACLESPILDALGRLEQRPVHALFGGPVREAADCYDGTLYFKDVELDTGVEVLADLARRIRADGYRALKMKVGRCDRWMPGEPGVDRDIEAVHAVRAAVGSNFNVMLDANNGYREHRAAALRFLRSVADCEPYWIEELFPEDVDAYRELRRQMHELRCTTRIADGESVNAVPDILPWVEAGVLDVVQPDLRTAGFSNVLGVARAAEQHGVTVVPHDWGSEIGKLMGVHAALAHRNVRFVEDDRYTNHAIDSSSFAFRDGRWHAPARPGWGFDLGDVYERFARDGEELVVE